MELNVILELLNSMAAAGWTVGRPCDQLGRIKKLAQGVHPYIHDEDWTGSNPQVINQAAKSAEHKQLPLKRTHSDFLHASSNEL